MDLFQLLGTISINNSEANKALDDTSDKGQKTQGKLSKAFSAVGKGAVAVGKTIGAGLLAGGAAMGALTVKALNLSGELEQNMGGSEQVFQEYADSMQKTAKEAFANMGLSTSDFLGTANKMGALFQGAGFDIKTSAEMSTEAMQRAADVASIMGIDTASAMEAIAGAAKGNFTMMDNLGVAMNDTTLQAYALSKGIEKSTQDMTNQEKIGLAMEMFMEKTAYAAGNYARENQTLAGSLTTAKAALTNFLDGSGDVTSLVSALTNAAGVIIKNISEIAPRLIEGVAELGKQLIPMLPGMISELLPVIVDGAVSLVDAVIGILPDLLGTLMDSILPNLLSGFETLMNSVVSALPSLLQIIMSALPRLLPLLINAFTSIFVTLCEMLPDLIQIFVSELPNLLQTVCASLLENLPIVINALIALIQGLIENLPIVLPTLLDMISGIINMIIQQLPVILPQLLNAVVSLVMLLVDQLPILIPMIVQFVVGLIELVASQLPTLIPIIADVLIQLINIIIEQLPIILPMVIDACITIIMAIIDNLPVILSSLINALPGILQAVWDAIVMIFENLPAWFGQIFSGAVEIIKGYWSSMVEFYSGLWDKIKGIFNKLPEWFSTTFKEGWNRIKTAWAPVGEWFSGIWNKIKGAFSSVGNFFKNAFQSAWNAIKNVFSGVGNFFGDIWNTIKDKFSAIGTKIGDAISGAVRGGINGLLGSAEKIINGFLGMINGAIDLINKIPGVNIKKVDLVSFTRLAEGGVVDEPTPAVFGEDGAEAVVPLENNTGWLNNVANRLHDLMFESQGDLAFGLSRESITLQRQQLNEMQTLNTKIDRIIGLLVQFFPEMLEALNIKMYLNDDILVAETAAKFDTALGMISVKKGRGR